MNIYRTIYDLALEAKAGTEYLSYGRPIIRDWAAEHVNGLPGQTPTPRVLDVGCGPGDDLDNIGGAVRRPCELHGVEAHDEYRQQAEARGIQTAAIDVERDVFPYPDEHFDVVVANQIIEHVKDTFFLISEVSRILRKGGLFLVGIPNLAAYHDRLILMLGQQPSGIKMLGPHVRGMTRPTVQTFMETDGYFVLRGFRGSGFYPFPASVSRVLARAFPSLATAIFFRFERTAKAGLFIDVLRSRFFETNYYTGPKGYGTRGGDPSTSSTAATRLGTTTTGKSPSNGRACGP